MSTVSSRQAWLAATVVFVLFFAFAPVATRDGRPFQIDEAHKISETHFLSLLFERDFHSPEWFRNVIDRSNPPIGKYLIGAAIRLHGLPLPAAPSLAALSPDGKIPAAFPRVVTDRYARYLAPARRAALFATALSAAVLVWCGLRFHGPVAAAAALLFFTFHHLTRGFGGVAVFDPLLAACAAAVLPAAAFLQRARGARIWLAALVAGVISGLAIGIRFNGGVCLLFVLITAVAAAVRARSAKMFTAAALIAVTSTAVVLASNPYYWGVPQAAPEVPAEMTAQEVLPVRIVNRVRYQLRDLSSITQHLGSVRMHSIPRRMQFFGLTMFGDLPGAALWLSVTLGVLLPVLRRRVTDPIRLVWIWTAVVAGTTALLLPVAWQRYLMIALPPLALLGGIGFAEMAGVATGFSRPRTGENSQSAG